MRFMITAIVMKSKKEPSILEVMENHTPFFTAVKRFSDKSRNMNVLKKT